MQLILLSGGSGRRLWPLSNEARSKQFIKLLETSDGSLQSMAQYIYGQLCDAGLSDNILISTNAVQRDSFISQLGENISILAEPERRDTFAAIVLACSYLYSKKKCDVNEPIVVLPCDQLVEKGYFDTIKKIGEAVANSTADLVLMGIQPTKPSTKYGYIIPSEIASDGSANVMCFKEKPDVETANKYITQGAFWNGGVFGFKLGYLISIIKSYLADISFDFLYDNFTLLPKISFDYEVVEKASNIKVITYSGKWEDLGTWTSFLSEIKRSVIGNGIITSDCQNTNIINELNVPVLCSGLSNIAIISTYDGVLVLDKTKSDNLKPYIEQVATRPLYEERRWGEYKVIDQQTFDTGYSQLTKHIVLNPGKFISYQVHRHRDEIWTIVDGTGLFVLDGVVTKVGSGDVLKIKAGQKHAIKAMETLTLIEVQLGTDLIEEDITRYNWDWE